MKIICLAKPQKPALINGEMNNVAVPSSSLSLVEWNGEVSNVWMKKMNLLALPSPSASPAEPNQEVDIC